MLCHDCISTCKAPMLLMALLWTSCAISRSNLRCDTLPLARSGIRVACTFSARKVAISLLKASLYSCSVCARVLAKRMTSLLALLSRSVAFLSCSTVCTTSILVHLCILMFHSLYDLLKQASTYFYLNELHHDNLHKVVHSYSLHTSHLAIRILFYEDVIRVQVFRTKGTSYRHLYK